MEEVKKELEEFKNNFENNLSSLSEKIRADIMKELENNLIMIKDVHLEKNGKIII